MFMKLKGTVGVISNEKKTYHDKWSKGHLNYIYSPFNKDTEASKYYLY